MYSTLKPGTGEKIKTTSKTILIVEDDGILCAGMQDVLTAAGYTILNTLSTGEAALEIIKEQLPDLIIMDIKLNGKIDGITTVRKIHAVAEIPVIYITAYADDTLIQQARGTTPYGYLVKPVPEREIIATIEMALGRCSLEKKLKETREALRQSEEFYRSIVLSVSEGIVIQDKWGKVITCNKSAREILELTSEEILGKISTSQNWKKFREDGSWFSLEEHPSILTLKTGKSCRNVILRYKKYDGKDVWLNINTSPIFKEGEDIPDAVVTSFSDITARKLAEQKITDYAVEMEQIYHHLDAEMDKAREIHQRILPKTFPEVEGISIASYYQPAKKTGGDFYDVVKTKGKLVIYLSDVMGHSLDSAMLSLFVKNTMNNFFALSSRDNMTPGKILAHLADQYYREDYPDDYFICIFTAVLDLETNELTYTGSGYHTPPFIRLDNGECTRLISKGLPIASAVLPELLDLSEDHIVLSPGTTILFATDGLLEQETGGEQYAGRLEEIFYKNSHLPPRSIVNIINSEFLKFNSGSLEGDDDITFLILQVHK